LTRLQVYQEEFGQVRGHFGPINTVAFAPDGRGFTTGGERLCWHRARMPRLGERPAWRTASQKQAASQGRAFDMGAAGAAAGEDGYVRLHHFDNDYFTTKFF
jgi:hypothetical protein